MNTFWPAAGERDWDAQTGLQDFHSFFATPKNRNYYDVCLGPVHLFVISTSANEPDGIGESGMQGQWLKAMLALSTAPWKVVLGAAILNWPFKVWGAHMLLAGELPYYERKSINGLVQINNGCGSEVPQLTVAPDGHTAFQSFTNVGAGILIATKCSLRYSFINTANVVIDGVTLLKPSDCVDPAEADASIIVAESAQQAVEAAGLLRVNTWPGDPNGHVLASSPAWCIDTVNNVVWVKDNGVTSTYGWE